MGRKEKGWGLFRWSCARDSGSGPLLGGVFGEMLGIPAMFALMGGLSGISLILALLFLPSRDSHRMPQEGTELHSIRSRRFGGLLLFRFLNAIARGVLLAYLPLWIDNFGIGMSQIGLLLSSNLLLTAALQQVFGKVADRVSRTFLIAVGSVLTAASLIGVALFPTPIAMVGISMLMGLGGGVAFPAAGAVATDLGRKYGMGFIMGWFNTAQGAGQVAGPLFAGLIMDHFGLPWVFHAMGFLTLIGTFWIVCGLSDKKESRAVSIQEDANR